jgi:NAD(P)-dependent dehydrogenase (short-subunit alcohol dehydrogenase family)
VVDLSELPLELGLEGHVALVTGAGGGIGGAAVRAFARSGARVFAVDRARESLERTQAGVADPARHRWRTLDVSDIAGHEELVAEVVRELGRVDSLTHTAAVLRRRATLGEISEEDWDIQIDINLKSTFFLNRAVGATLVAQGRGSITNFTSQGWWTGGFGGSVVYAASKGGVVSLSRGLARSFAASGVRVNTIAPGAADTAMMRQDQTEQQLAEFVRTIPLGRMAAPEEVASVAVFLASEHARYITGATINVTGGQLMY